MSILCTCAPAAFAADIAALIRAFPFTSTVDVVVNNKTFFLVSLLKILVDIARKPFFYTLHMRLTRY
jgi:hypothetical protein